MKRVALAVVLIMTAVSYGCGDKPKTTVVLIDATLSIDAAEYERCRHELERLTQRLGRGDRLVLVPITGEPLELLGHRIVNIEIPKERVPYDTNLKKARVEAARRIAQFLAELPTIQASQTNIIAALRATADQFRSATKAQLLCLSDMVEANGDLWFTTAPELTSVKTAEALAERVARKNMLTGVDVRIGILKSSDLEKMNSTRRDAVMAFWQRYFNASGASKVKISVDLETLSE
jgi:hypothetical protein